MENTVNCPQCGAELNVEEVLGHRIEERYQQEYRTKIAEMETGIKKRETALVQKEKTLKEQQTAIEEQVAEQTKTAVAKREKEIAKQTEEKIKSEYEVQVKSLSEAAAETNKQLQVLKSAQIENEKLKRQIESQKQDLELQFEKQFSQKLKEEAETISKKEAERHETKMLEIQKKLDDQTKLAEEMKRKAEQGSQQIGGEIQELQIEDSLRKSFPSDLIEEIAKGKNGADVKQIVRNSFGAEAGIILYESKNTKDFKKDWIAKLKSDTELEKANVPVLVTKTMPRNMEHLGLIDGVWVCSVPEFQGLAMVLREGLLRVSEVLVSQTNREDKMQILYDYLTGGKFGDQIQRVISQFRTLREGYQKEKEAMQKIWKKRDAQLESMLQSTSDFVMHIQTIAGSKIPQLEAPEEELLALETET
ncbi:MAG: DUF2130 domain-containing protein [Planctomycetaceae bacterium]|jgi:hypothetical protein|nr:DUF2130 domain-containing protein [Planctomycetaceae bacterium]